MLGRLKAGTLALTKDAKGLRVVITPPDTTLGRDTLTLVQRGDVSGMSFSFKVQPGGERFERRDGRPVRIISDAVIHDVSVVTFPAYQAADVSVAQRSLQAWAAITPGPRVDWLRLWQVLRG